MVLDQDVTHAHVLGALPGHAVAHFACHALTNTHKDSQQNNMRALSALTCEVKSQNPQVNSLRALTPGQVLCCSAITGQSPSRSQRSPGSGCATPNSPSSPPAGTTPGLADEGINIAAAFQLAGYLHVVGTLWPLADDVAPAMAKAFLDGLEASRPHPERAPYALRAASLASRAEHEGRPTAWAAHIHVGA